MQKGATSSGCISASLTVYELIRALHRDYNGVRAFIDARVSAQPCVCLRGLNKSIKLIWRLLLNYTYFQ
ncbi:hypothetical protein WN48_10437 [Eufriesea mexicana]|uniref:Uncharacterized protein n=1 Tax=Eufriesea mexicana TaxID=516756 RepID=A0A310S6K1_9HYME|nr:hypothetical protein WN48_10437 [Eufriesea mexicana]